MNILIDKGSTLFPYGSICEVFKIDVERIGTFRQEREMPEERQRGMSVDVDDEDEFAEKEDKNPLPEHEVVRTWLLVASPKNGSLRWLDADTVTYISAPHCKTLLALRKLKKNCMRCSRCSIGGKGGNVFSNMNYRADIMVVGQNPGKEEVKQGTPFVGKSGAFFDKCLKTVLGIDRSRLYICNVCRCFTEGNRKPTPDEIEYCWHFLRGEAGILKPQVIVTLGAPAYEMLAAKRSSISLVQGVLQDSKLDIPLLPLFHPSPLNMNNHEKRGAFKSGLRKLKEFLK